MNKILILSGSALLIFAIFKFFKRRPDHPKKIPRKSMSFFKMMVEMEQQKKIKEKPPEIVFWKTEQIEEISPEKKNENVFVDTINSESPEVNNEPKLMAETDFETRQEETTTTPKKETTASEILDAIVCPKPRKHICQDFKFFINHLPPSPIPELNSVFLGMCESPEDEYEIIF
jgi:hypothetical protein